MYYCQNMLSYEKAYIIITPASKCSIDPHVTPQVLVWPGFFQFFA